MNFGTILSAYRRALETGRADQANVFEHRLMEMWRRRRQSSSFCAADVDRVIRLVADGMSVVEACARENVEEKRALYEIMRRGGLKKLRPRLTTSMPRMEGPMTVTALRLVKEGKTIGQASAMSGATQDAIRSALARRGGLHAFRDGEKS